MRIAGDYFIRTFDLDSTGPHRDCDCGNVSTRCLHLVEYRKYDDAEYFLAQETYSCKTCFAKKLKKMKDEKEACNSCNAL